EALVALAQVGVDETAQAPCFGVAVKPVGAAVLNLSEHRVEGPRHARTPPSGYSSVVGQTASCVAADHILDGEYVCAEIWRPAWLQACHAEVVEDATIGEQDAM